MNTEENKKQNKSSKKRSKTARNFYKKSSKALSDHQLAVEETKKLYQKYYEIPNPLFISQLKTETLNIYLSNFKLNDISVINKILSKYYFTKNLTLSPIDPAKSNSKTTRKKNSREPITEGEKVKLAKEQKDKQLEYNFLINKLTLGVGKHIAKNSRLESFSLLNLELDQKLAQNLSFGICQNKSIKKFKINNCKMDIQSYEILLKGLFSHEKIEKLDLQNNNLEDKYGNMIGRIISRQTDRRDQLIWLYAIRNESPDPEEFGSGLISINLNGNNLSSYAADCITTALALDQYVRSIILTNNNFDTESCKKFIYMLRRNMTLLNIDLKSNPGYNENVQKRLIIKMSKNIKNLYSKFKNNEISEQDFENYKKFINSSLFFNIEIPEDVVDNYNHINKITEDIENDNNIKIKDNNKENGMVLKDLNEENNINKNNIKNKAQYILPNPKTKTSDEENKKLIEENLLLKQKILKLEAENIKNISGKKVNLPSKFKNESLKKNFKQAEELLDKLNNLMNKMESEEDIKKNSEKKSKDIPNNNLDNKIKIKNIVINDKKEENKISNQPNKKENKEKEKKEKEKKEIKLNLDDNNKDIFKKEENNLKKKNDQINNKDKFEINNFNNNKNNNKSEQKDNIINNKINNKKEENKIMKNNNINKKIEKEEEKENEENENFDENEEAIIEQHKLLFEQLKKEYESKGLKFEMEDFLELLQNQGEFDEEEEDEYEGF